MNTEMWKISDRQEARKTKSEKENIIKVTHDLVQLTDISKAACPVLDWCLMHNPAWDITN